MAEAKKRASESFAGTEVTAFYEHRGDRWPYAYRTPTTKIIGLVTNKTVKVDTRTGAAEQDYLEFMTEILLQCLVDAPFNITRQNIEKLDPGISSQMIREIGQYLGAGVIPKKS